jgi:hypothetical protein
VAKKISEYGENPEPQMRPTYGSDRQVAATAADFTDAALGEAT